MVRRHRTRKYEERISSGVHQLSPLDVDVSSLKVDTDGTEVVITGPLTSMNAIEVDRDSKLVVHGDLSNIRHVEADRSGKIVVKGDLRGCDKVEADREGVIDVSGRVQDVQEVEADRSGEISVGSGVFNSSTVEHRGGSIDATVDSDEDSDSDDVNRSDRSFEERGYEGDRMQDLKNIEVSMPDEHLAVWIECRLQGVEISGHDFEIVYQQYPELAKILKQVDSVDKAIELSRKNASIDFTERQIELMRRAEKVARRKDTDDVIDAITEAVDAAELRSRINETNPSDDDEDEGMSVLQD